ncbi:4'-phosphopantetheinyl transferase superfamily protein [Streptomyces sp. NPDC096097]|uniref:4'-phosphopantetheinyl transferase family protein n=1 Tax=Streptomyces sp. NPDC096097 TaxID=3155546 RepID=UPI00332A8D99
MINTSALKFPAELTLGGRPEDVRRALCDTDDGTLSLWTVDSLGQGAVAAGLAPGVLDGMEQQRAAAFHRSAERRCYVVAHVALRAVLGAHLGIAPGAVQLVREPCPSCGGPHGRPAVEGGGVHFSLSHSGDLVLIGIAGAPVGVDVEGILRPDAVAQVSSAMHPTETAELAAAPDHAKPMALARAWARKESYLKGIGAGLSRSPALDYVGTGPTPGPAPRGWTLGDVAVPEGFAAAYALRSHGR